MSVYHLHAWCSGRPEEVTDPMELEPQMVVSRRVVLGTELGTWNGTRNSEPLLLFAALSLQFPTLHSKTVSVTGAKEVGQAGKPVSSRDLPVSSTGTRALAVA